MSLDYILTQIIDNSIDLKYTINQFLTHTVQLKEFDNFIKALATLKQPTAIQLYYELKDLESKLTLLDEHSLRSTISVFSTTVPKSPSNPDLNREILYQELRAQQQTSQPGAGQRIGGIKNKNTTTRQELEDILDLDDTWTPQPSSKPQTASQQTTSSTITASEGRNMDSDDTTQPPPLERQVNFNLNPLVKEISEKCDNAPLEQLIGVFEKTLSNAFHQKPNAIKPFTTDDVNALPVKDFADSLANMYLQAPKLHERDIHQIRFILAMYDERGTLSNDAYHDVVSQVILFYHVTDGQWHHKCVSPY